LWSTPKRNKENIAQLKQEPGDSFYYEQQAILGELDILASVMLPLDHSVVEKAKNKLIDLLSQDQYIKNLIAIQNPVVQVAITSLRQLQGDF